MSVERAITYKLRESRMIKESEFTSGGSTYKCVFGRYYKDDEEISREEYFKAQDANSGGASPVSHNSPKKSYEEYSPEEFDSAIDDIESKIDDIEQSLEDIPYSERGDYEETLEDLSSNLMAMEEYLTDEQYERTSELIDKISNVKEIDYSGNSTYDPYADRGLRQSDFY